MGKLSEGFIKSLESLTARHGSIAELVRSTEISRTTFDRWFQRANAPDLDQVETIAKALGKQPWELLFGKIESSFAWRDVIRRIGEIDDSQVPAIIAGISAALAALRPDDQKRVPGDILQMLATAPQAHEAVRSLLLGVTIQQESKVTKGIKKTSKSDQHR